MDLDADRLIQVGLCLISFLLGSIPFGILVARLFNVKDLRSKGSGNIGATNVARVAGFWPAGFLTLVLDALKGVIPVVLTRPGPAQVWVRWFHTGDVDLMGTTAWFVGLFALLGHCYSPWLRFKGGKGVATGLGALLVLSPVAASCGVIAFIVTFLNHRIGSLSSIAGLIAVSVAQVVLYPGGAYLVPGGLMIFVVLMRHEKNIEALLENRESRF